MKRLPELWFLLSAGVVWLCLQDVYGIKATSLIFGKSTTTPSPIEGPPVPINNEETAQEWSTEPPPSNSTRATLTGIPQIDYIWDPNLPKELNGYNLSEYPFYERVPDEEIEFKCDGLHDGFYASVPHKCQVYHHCLYGTRYDFLCANYTAFDQKTFICHFVSEVDCVNSKKYWHRNDALYQAATTTTPKPVVTAPPSTTPPPPPPQISRRPVSGGRRRPMHRRRPHYDYYEDYEEEYEYEERPRRRRIRPRSRPRPVYDEEYEDYEEDRYERRGNRRRINERRRNKDRRKHIDDDYLEEEHDRRPLSSKRRPVTEAVDDRRHESRPKLRRPVEEDYEELPPKTEEPQTRQEVIPEKPAKPSVHERLRPPPEPAPEKPIPTVYERPRAPPKEVHEPIPEKHFKYHHERPRIPQNEPVPEKPITKPSSGIPPVYERQRQPVEPEKPVKPTTIYDKPRAPPKIKPPVPKNEAEKYAYKPQGAKPLKEYDDKDLEEYYDDYDDGHGYHHGYHDDYYEEPVTKSKREQDTSENKHYTKPINRKNPRRPSKEEEEEEEIVQLRPNKKIKTRVANRRPPTDDYYEEYEDEITETKPKTTSTTTTTTTPQPSTSKTVKESSREIVRIVKRPFLPSRGGNPYLARGLQPVGAKSLDTSKSELKTDEPSKPPIEEPIFKPSPVIIKVPMRQQTQQEDDFTPVSNRPQVRPQYSSQVKQENMGPRTTQKPKIRDPLDIDDYDVTLNDALNPTLPNLPVRGYPSGFSPNNDYNNYQRPAQYDQSSSQTRSDYTVYEQNKPVRRDQDYQGQYSTIVRPRIHQQLPNYYPNY